MSVDEVSSGLADDSDSVCQKEKKKRKRKNKIIKWWNQKRGRDGQRVRERVKKDKNRAGWS